MDAYLLSNPLFYREKGEKNNEKEIAVLLFYFYTEIDWSVSKISSLLLSLLHYIPIVTVQKWGKSTFRIFPPKIPPTGAAVA